MLKKIIAGLFRRKPANVKPSADVEFSMLRLARIERALFQDARPRVYIDQELAARITTYNHPAIEDKHDEDR